MSEEPPDLASPVCYAGDVDPAYMGLSRLRPFGPDIWTAEGSVVSFLGFPYPTRMAIVRLGDGGLFVWSPIALDDALKREVDALGPVRHLATPNAIHHLFLSDWKRAYAAARLYAPPGLRRKRRDLAFDAELGDAPDPAWSAEIDQVAMRGSIVMTEIVFFHRRSRTAIFGDIIQNFRPEWFGGWRRIVARLDGIVAPRPGAPREWRASFLGRKRARASLSRILAWPIERVIIAHGELPLADARDFVASAFGWLS